MVEKRATLAAEYSVIGALLLDPKIAGELFAATRESDFLRAELRTVYTAAREIFNRGRPLDPVTIRAAIGKEYEPLLMECMDVCSTASAWKADPYDTIWKLMEPYEIDQLGGKLYKWLGLIGEKAEARTEEAAKNS